MADFTNWNDLFVYMKNLLANSDPTVGSVMGSDGKGISWNSFSEFLKVLQYVETRAKAESGTLITRVGASLP